jgi:hypothetical protein
VARESGTPQADWALPIFGVIGLAIVGAFLGLDFVPDWWANNFYTEGRCVLLDKRVVEHRSSGGKANSGTYRPEFLIRYTVAGREYQAWAYRAVRSSSAWRWPKERLLERYTVGQEYPCWYDPADPTKVVFVRGYSGLSYGLLLAFGVLAFLTGWGVLRRVRGARRAVDEAGGVGPDPAEPGAAPDRGVTAFGGEPLSGRRDR